MDRQINLLKQDDVLALKYLREEEQKSKEEIMKPEQRQKLGERLKRARQQKLPDSPSNNVITMKSRS